MSGMTLSCRSQSTNKNPLGTDESMPVRSLHLANGAAALVQLRRITLAMLARRLD